MSILFFPKKRKKKIQEKDYIVDQRAKEKGWGKYRKNKPKIEPRTERGKKYLDW